MYQNKRILGFIPARGGSKGISNKNIRMLGGKPLIAYTIEAAIQANCFDEIIVSTDSESIADIAVEYGASVPFLRSKVIAGDTSKVIEAQLDVLNRLKSLGIIFDLIVLLQPTSPFRTSCDIIGAIEFFMDNNLPNLASISLVNDHPILIRTLSSEMEIKPLLQFPSNVRRQDFFAYYRVNGAIYINRTRELNSSTSQNDNAFGYIIEPLHAIDIDTVEDLIFAEVLLNKGIVDLSIAIQPNTK